MRPGSRSVEIVVQQQYVLTSVTLFESGFRVVSVKNRTATRHARRRRPNQCQGSCCWYERTACRTAVNVESRLVRVTPWTTAWLECAVSAFFGAVCVGVFVAFSACAPWMIEFRTCCCSFQEALDRSLWLINVPTLGCVSSHRTRTWQSVLKLALTATT